MQTPARSELRHPEVTRLSRRRRALPATGCAIGLSLLMACGSMACSSSSDSSNGGSGSSTTTTGPSSDASAGDAALDGSPDVVARVFADRQGASGYEIDGMTITFTYDSGNGAELAVMQCLVAQGAIGAEYDVRLVFPDGEVACADALTSE